MEGTRYIEHPRYQGIIIRRTLPRLQELIARAHYYYRALGGHYAEQAHVWTFPSGATIRFRPCEHDADWRDIQGHQYQFMGIDQLEEFDEDLYENLLMQNRTGVKELPPYTRSTFNPGGEGHGFVKERFIDHGTRDCAPWQPRNDEGKPMPDRCFHFASIDDNPLGEAADPTYRMRLEALAEDKRRAYLYGDWDVFAGQYFSEWRRLVHVEERVFKIPSTWRRWCSMDWGFVEPLCLLWFAEDPDPISDLDMRHRLYIYRELYVVEHTPEMVAMRILLTQENQALRCFASPDLWAKTQMRKGVGVPRAQLFAEAFQKLGVQVTLIPANDDRLAGWDRMHQALAWKSSGVQEPELRIFASCHNLIRTLPAMVHDDRRVEDIKARSEDHAVESARYGLAGGRSGERPQARDVIYNDRGEDNGRGAQIGLLTQRTISRWVERHRRHRQQAGAVYYDRLMHEIAEAKRRR